MEWCVVEWSGVGWSGVEWSGVEWCGVVWCGVVWCGVVWCGVVWCGVVWCGGEGRGVECSRVEWVDWRTGDCTRTVTSNVEDFPVQQHGTVRYGTVQCGGLWCACTFVLSLLNGAHADRSGAPRVVQPHVPPVVQVACIADTAIGVLAGACAAGLVYFSLTGSWRLDRTGWREQSRDDARVERYAKLRERDPNVLHVREVHRNVLLGLLVLLVLALAVGAAVLVTFLTRDHGPQDRGTYMYEVAGWSNRNTRLRYAWTAIAMLTILANLLPVSHRVVAYAYAFVYCAVVGMALTSFGLDLHEVSPFPCLSANHPPSHLYQEVA